MLLGSPLSLAKSRRLVLWKPTPVMLLRIGSMFLMVPALRLSCLARTCGLVGSRTQSRRRSTVRGRITLPYWAGLYGPRSRSATLQVKLTLSEKPFTPVPSPGARCNLPRTRLDCIRYR
jgi:hypothetical protein